MLLCFDLNRVTYKDSGWYQTTFFLRISSLKCRWHPLNAGELTQTLLFMNNYRGRHVCYYMLMNTHCTYCVPLYNILYIYIYIYIFIYMYNIYIYMYNIYIYIYMYNIYIYIYIYYSHYLFIYLFYIYIFPFFVWPTRSM